MDIHFTPFDTFVQNEEHITLKRHSTIPVELTPWKSEERIEASIKDFINTEYGSSMILKFHGFPLIFCQSIEDDVAIIESMMYPVAMNVGRIEAIHDTTVDAVINKGSYAYRTYLANNNLATDTHVRIGGCVEKDGCTFIVLTLRKNSEEEATVLN